MNRYENVIAQTGESAVSSNKVLKNTYLLLSATLGFSAVMAMVSMVIGVPPITYLVAVIARHGDGYLRAATHRQLQQWHRRHLPDYRPARVSVWVPCSACTWRCPTVRR